MLGNALRRKLIWYTRQHIKLGVRMKKCGVIGGLVLSFVLIAASASAANYPSCFRKTNQMQLNNQEVIEWKTTTKNQYHDRGYVVGKVVQALVDRDTHLHLEINLDPSSNDRAKHIEIVYNKEFGPIPAFHQGSEAVVCGDYITSNQATNQYPASPVGAIIHWIHMSPTPARHENGYMMLDGVETGQINPGDRHGDMRQLFSGNFLAN